ncbi:MAG: phage portal protein [Sphingomonadaceae bacterium]|nr:phage portal protein [Sphingomonadaceae bacterium]
MTALLGPDGQTIPAATIAGIRNRARALTVPGRTQALAGGGGPSGYGQYGAYAFPYDAAQIDAPDMADWLPLVRSPDYEVNTWRDRIAARARDLHRNDGWAKGAISRILDSTIGASYRLVSRPDYRALALHDKAFDATWAAEFGRAAEALWRGYAEGLGHWNDVSRRQTISQQFRMALGQKLVDGESVIAGYWLPERVGAGGARYATSFLGIDADRLSNPQQQPDTRFLRGGVEVDGYGVPLAYHIRKAHQYDWYNAVESVTWERVPFEDDDGFRRIYHDYDPDRWGQNRGISIFAPVLGRLRMLAKYYGIELSAASVASAFGLYATSPFDPEMVRNALDDGDDAVESAYGWYQDMRADFHRDRDLSVNGVKVATLAPGEDLKTVAPVRPNSGFSPFTHEMLRSFAAVLGMSGEQVHNDYGDASWSSARAGIVEAEKTFIRRMQDFNLNTATPMFAAWLREALDNGELPLPRRVPDFAEAMTAFARCRWLGAARGWVDPVSERQGVILGLDGALSTLEDECAKQGTDWEENVDQRAIEFKRMAELGLPRPEWMGSDKTPADDASATDAAKKPERPQA